MIIKEAKLKFAPRFLFSLMLLFFGAIWIHKNIFDMHWLSLFLILSVICYIKIDSSIQLHEHSIMLTGPLFWGTLIERRLDKIQSIDAVSINGVYFFRLVFDVSTIRSNFWKGTDNFLILSHAFFHNTEAIVRAILDRYPGIPVGHNAQALLDGTIKTPKHIAELLCGGFSLTIIFVLYLMLRNKF